MMARLDSLPPELVFKVLDDCGAFDPRSLPDHPLFAVAATSHRLRDIVEEYTHGLLKTHAEKQLPESSDPAAALVCRKRWLEYVSTTCPFCLTWTGNKAILDARMPCCSRCDLKKFPKMVSLSLRICNRSLSTLYYLRVGDTQANCTPTYVPTLDCIWSCFIYL
jgi:hypothetical protein